MAEFLSHQVLEAITFDYRLFSQLALMPHSCSRLFETAQLSQTTARMTISRTECNIPYDEQVSGQPSP